MCEGGEREGGVKGGRKEGVGRRGGREEGGRDMYLGLNVMIQGCMRM